MGDAESGEVSRASWTYSLVIAAASWLLKAADIAFTTERVPPVSLPPVAAQGSAWPTLNRNETYQDVGAQSLGRDFLGIVEEVVEQGEVGRIAP